MNQNISDTTIVLSRINYGETDRILNVLSRHHGKISILAKGVRKAQSKLAAGIELFSENEVVLHRSKSDMHILTSGRMKNYYGEIAKDLDASNVMYECLKIINKIIPEGQGSEYYSVLKNILKEAKNNEIPIDQLKIWFDLKVLKLHGSLPNLNTDPNGNRLDSKDKFQFDYDKQAFFTRSEGRFNSDNIKVLRRLAKAQRPIHITGCSEALNKSSARLSSEWIRSIVE